MYLVVLFVFFDKFLEVGARVANFLLARVENDLSEGRGTTFWLILIQKKV